MDKAFNELFYSKNDQNLWNSITSLFLKTNNVNNTNIEKL
jgi:hypothetical protein